MKLWRTVSQRPIRASLIICLVIVLAILESNLFDIYAWPSIAPVLGAAYQSDATFILDIAYLALFGGIVLPTAKAIIWIVDKTLNWAGAGH